MTPGPVVELIEDEVAQIGFDFQSALPEILTVAGIMLVAYILWRVVKRFVK